MEVSIVNKNCSKLHVSDKERSTDVFYSHIDAQLFMNKLIDEVYDKYPNAREQNHFEGNVFYFYDEYTDYECRIELLTMEVK